ncbi:2-keto-4-pentenoate hydratase [Kordiimonas aestuarii]|uniref:2-keto-4-pentenoate hydratase n=1 Tax=Kordiimonas aestuarii TaxID=1005925 RepID=UPI0021CFCDB4|nr:2-keto-4-pentenoate hydratase [Kordiimonas aestuarii]
MNSIKHPSAGGIARAFVSARAKGSALADFPGAVPADLTEAYKIQDAAIDLWQDAIGGWKVGRIGEPLAREFGVDRLAGPIFKRHIWHADAEATTFPIFDGGFGAVEAEFVLEIGADTPADKTTWSREEARAAVSAVYTGVEIASSPLAIINQLGPRVIVSDFGNNASLIVGPELQGWQTRTFEDWRAETYIEDKSIATGNAGGLPGGPFESVRFLLELSARRGMPLKAGCLVSSGAITGVHDILPGQHSRISFGKDGDIFCSAVKGGPEREAFPDAFTA